MNVTVLHNPLSGYGRSNKVAQRLRRTLEIAGHRVSIVQVGAPAPAPTPAGANGHAANGQTSGQPSAPTNGHPAPASAAPPDVLVIVGGDGTLHHALGEAVASGVPVYHAPLGTENLFARQFGMDTRDATLLRALSRQSVRSVDLARLTLGAAGHPPVLRTFALMCSMGFDASVIHRRESARLKASGHGAYLLPILGAILAPRFPRLRIEVDGETVLDGARGQAIVANSRQYALRIDPAVRGDMGDGLLDLVMFPCGSALDLAGWSLTARLRRHTASPNLIYRTGRSITVTSLDGPAPVQVDGEAIRVHHARAEVDSMSVEVVPGALRVLEP